MRRAFRYAIALSMIAGGAVVVAAQPPGIQSQDLSSVRAVSGVTISPDGSHVAYVIAANDRPGRPYSQLWIMESATGRTVRVGGDAGVGGDPHWAPDGSRLAYRGRQGDRAGLMVARPDGTDTTFLAEMLGTNSPQPGRGADIAWSPDGTEIAYVSATPGPESPEANGDPAVITRYLYKPTASEGLTRFNDNRRLHLFIVDLTTKQSRQLTSGDYYEHSIDWSPDGRHLVFISNHEPDPDRVFNYDIFTARVSDGRVERLTHTRNAEYSPIWSPDGRTIAYLGTRRPLTSSETTMEDTHVWLMDADGTRQRELGRDQDARQGDPRWSADGRFVYFSVQERGSVHLRRLAASGGQVDTIIGDTGRLRAWDVGRDGVVAYSLATPGSPAELFLNQQGTTRGLTSLNQRWLLERRVAPVESFTFDSLDGRLQVEAFLTEPVDLSGPSTHPLIVLIHGGPHGQQGPAFDFHAQVYAAHGYATLMVNYRGSTGYGQSFEDAIFGDQDGAETKDVLAAVDVAVERYPWIDRNRMGVEGTSYGGQLTNWIITQTNQFAAAIPTAGISNLVSLNYMSYYHDYLAVEYGGYPTQDEIMDELWRRSALRNAARVRTPTMFCHGENDNDVPIAEDEQFYIALKDVGVETVMVRYPREGHGIRETQHVVDWIDRSIRWYDRHFAQPASTRSAR